MAIERTLVFIKPDALNRGLAGQIISRFESKGLKIIGSKFVHIPDAKLEEHYSHIKNKPFFPGLRNFIQKAPSFFLVLEGLNAVEVVRKMAGITHAGRAEPGTIRGDFALSMQSNVIHASESKDAAQKEIRNFFSKEEIHSWKKIDSDILYAEDEKSMLNKEISKEL